MVKRPGDNTGAAFGECCRISAGAYRGSMSGAILVYRGGAGESESEELSAWRGVGGGDGEGVKVGRDEGGEFNRVLGAWRRARLRVVRGVVLEGKQDSLGGG